MLARTRVMYAVVSWSITTKTRGNHDDTKKGIYHDDTKSTMDTQE